MRQIPYILLLLWPVVALTSAEGALGNGGATMLEERVAGAVFQGDRSDTLTGGPGECWPPFSSDIPVWSLE
ncbi:MAG TPA: hypothetical protein VNL72_01400 [Gammaproteobacteria bacterium]|nr:hypothetical protein [Gammaproteobacteria bacterium]